MVAGIALEEEHRMSAACHTEGRGVVETGNLHHTVIEVVHTHSKEVHFQCSSSRQYRLARLIGYWDKDLMPAVVQMEAAHT
jgi:hypothetical protein